MQNQIQYGYIIDLEATQPLRGGDIVKAGDLIGIATTDANEGQTLAVQLVGVFSVPKAKEDIATGQRLYYNEKTKLVTKVSEGNTFCGHATQAARTEEPTVFLRLAH